MRAGRYAPATVTRRDRHKQERLDLIRAAAWDLFRTQGYEPTLSEDTVEMLRGAFVSFNTAATY